MSSTQQFPALAITILAILAPPPVVAQHRSVGQIEATPKSVLLQFQAEWCTQCRAAQPLMQQIKARGYPVRVIDVDRQAALAHRFKISAVPTFVVIAAGREVDRQVGVPGGARLREMLQQLRSTAATAEQLAAADRSRERRSAASLRSTAARTHSAPRWSHSAAGVQAASLATTAPPGANRFTTVSPPPAAPAAEPQDVTVRISVDELNGRAYGSGTIIASQPGEATILTCGHLFRDSGGRGDITVDVFTGGQTQSYTGRLVFFNDEADVGLVRITPETCLPSIPIAPRGYALQPGRKTVNVGCSGGAAPSVMRGQITAIDRYLGPSNLECTGLPVQGRSGGGLFSTDGYVIGICTAADPSEGKGLYASLRAIHEELDKRNLSKLYDRPAGAPMFASTTAGANGSTQSDWIAKGKHEGGQSLADLLAEAGEAEVVCVVRPLKDARARSRVVVLDRASRDFLLQLAREQDVQQSRQLTSLHVGANKSASIVPESRLPRPRLHPVLRIHSARPRR